MDQDVIDITLEDTSMKSEKSADVAAMDEAYKLGRKDADRLQAEMDARKVEYEAVGKIRAAEFNIKANELLKYVTLFQVKKDKEYRKQGRTWEEFCRAIGESDRSVDRVLSEIAPLAEHFSANLAETMGMPFNKIRYLGRSISASVAEIADDAILIGDQRIELRPENKEDLEAAIDALRDAQEKEREQHQAEVTRLKKRADGAVSEETRSLKTERDAFKRELERLKALDPEEKDASWSVDQLQEIVSACAEFSVRCRRFVLDERLDGNVELQAKVEGLMTQAELSLKDLRQLWDERFNNFEE